MAARYVACALVGGLAWGPVAAGAGEMPFEAYAAARLARVQSELDAARPGYVLVLGDSNAAAAPARSVDCGRGVVNAGIGNVRAGQYLAMVSGLRFGSRGAAAILNVGTGDAWRGLDPLAAGPAAAYEESVAGLVALVRPHVARVLVAALPPLSGRPADKLDPEAVEAYSLRLRAMCARGGCDYVDPWAAMRGDSFGLAKPGASRDGLHPDDPGAAYASLGLAHCGTAGARAGR